MFSSPSQEKQSEPGKTPSRWAAALGIFSTAKKPPRPSSVEARTTDTTGDVHHNAHHNLSAVTETSFQQQQPNHSTTNGGTGLDASMTSENETFMSPLSPHLSTAGPTSTASASLSRNGTGQSFAATMSAHSHNSSHRKPSRLEFSALGPSRTAVASTPLAEGATNQLASFSTAAVAGSAAQSPWYNNNNNNNNKTNNTRGVSFQLGTNHSSVGGRSTPWQGKRSRHRRNDTPGANATRAPQQQQPQQQPQQQSHFLTRPIVFRTGGAASQRTRRYRPNAVGLVGTEALGRPYARKGPVDPAQVSNALLSLKDSFLPDVTAGNSNELLPGRPSSVIYASGRGKLKYGSLDSSSRTPRLVQKKRQRPVVPPMPPGTEQQEEGSEGDGRRNKRQKKVYFGDDPELVDNEDAEHAVIGRITSTPARRIALRKGTPMPRKLMPTTPADSVPYEQDDGNDGVGDDGNQDGAAFTSPSKASDQLPDRPPPYKFVSGKTLRFDDVMPQDSGAAVLDPIAQGLLLKKNAMPRVSDAAAVSFKHPDERKAATYDRPPSPVRERITYGDDVEDDDDDDGVANGGQKTKRMKMDDKVPDWKCSKCGNMNDNDESRCTKADCQTGRTIQEEGNKNKSNWGDSMSKFMAQEGEWICQACLVKNKKGATKCEACEEPKGAKGVSKDPKEANKTTASGPAPAPEVKTSFPFATTTTKPGAILFGSNPTPSLSVPAGTPATSKFEFNVPAAAPATTGTGATVGGFTFGGTTGTTPAPAPAPATDGFKFNDDAKKSAAPISFGSTPAAATAPAAEASSAFGGPPAPATDKPLFGASAASKTNDTATPEAAKPFDPAPAPAPAPALFVFGQKKDDASAAPTPAAPTPAAGFPVSQSTTFGAAASTTPAPPATNGNSGFSFGTSTPAPSAPAETKSTQKVKRSRGYDLNGDSGAAPAPASAAKPAPAPTLFGAPAPSTTAPSTEAPFKFGRTPAPAPAADGSAAQPFGGTPAVPFGGPAAAPAPAPTGGTQFGTATPAPAGNAFTFGATQTPAPAPSAPAGGFGATPAASGPAPTVFGATAPAAPLFGNTSASSIPGFGSTPAAPAPATTNFGSTPATTFGSTSAAPAPAPISFGSTPSAPAPAATNFGSTPAASTPAATTFGSTAPAPGFAFGASQAPAFGAPAPAAPAFGASNPQASTSFGAAPAFGAQTPAAPPGGGFNGTFGANQAPNTGGFGANPNAGGFGSTPAAPNAGGFGSNGFGAPQTGGFQSTPAAPGGFGGAAPNTAPPSFSIGTAGAPKSRRRLVRAKRPTRPA